jgi:hypothetical protein
VKVGAVPDTISRTVYAYDAASNRELLQLRYAEPADDLDELADRPGCHPHRVQRPPS